MARSPRVQGSVLIIVAILMVVLFPILLVFLKNASYQNNFAMQDRQIKATRSLANNVMTDFMRQFSQRPVETGNTIARIGITPATDPLIRLADSFIKSGFSETSVTPIADTNSLYFEASGFLRRDGDPEYLKIKKMSGIVRIENPILRYGDSRDPRYPASWGTSWVIVSNIFFPKGLSIHPAFSYTFTDTVSIDGDLACSPTLESKFLSIVYISGSISGNCSFSSDPIPIVPKTKFIPIDLSYYFEHNSLLTKVEEWWVFGVDAGGNGIMNRYSVLAGPAKGGLIGTLTIPASGAIFVSSGTVVHLEGNVRGRVTVVAGTSTPGHHDSVLIENDLVYDDMDNSADPGHSFAVLTDGKILAKKPGNGILTTDGLFYSSQDKSEPNLNYVDPVPSRHRNFGTMASIWWGPPLSTCVPEYWKDPNLSRFPPPGIPSQAYLVNWRLE